MWVKLDMDFNFLILLICARQTHSARMVELENDTIQYDVCLSIKSFSIFDVSFQTERHGLTVWVESFGPKVLFFHSETLEVC